jgi:hypothetical protein
MLTENRLFYVWCVLVGGIFLASILPGDSSVYQFISVYDTNRWVHFLGYASIAAIPVAKWKPRARVLLSLLPALISIALEVLQTHDSAPVSFLQNVPADFFGLAAGILLGMNLRVMHNSAKSLSDVSSNPSSSKMF